MGLNAATHLRKMGAVVDGGGAKLMKLDCVCICFAGCATISLAGNGQIAGSSFFLTSRPRVCPLRVRFGYDRYARPATAYICVLMLGYL